MAKEHPIDIETRNYRALQDSCAHDRKNRIPQLLLVILSALLIVGLGVAVYLLPHKAVSEEENRNLQGLPRFSAEAFLSGEYTADIATFYADQFPLRNGFVGLKALSEAALLKQENNGVLVGKDGYLIDRLEYDDAEYENLSINLAAIRKFTALAEESGVKTVFAAAPRTVDVMESAFQQFQCRSARHKSLRPLGTPAPGQTGRGIDRFNDEAFASLKFKIVTAETIPLHNFVSGIVDKIFLLKFDSSKSVEHQFSVIQPHFAIPCVHFI